MIKLYNTQSKIANDLTNFFTSINSNLSKPNLKLISPIILGMIEAESIVQTDIVKKLKGPFSLVQPSSTIRRLERFFNNPKLCELCKHCDGRGFTGKEVPPAVQLEKGEKIEVEFI